MSPKEGIGNSRGVERGSSKAKQFKGKYEAKLEFPGGNGNGNGNFIYRR